MAGFYEDIVAHFSDTFFGSSSRLAIMYLCSAIIIAYLIWLYRGRKTSFTAFILPKSVYLHRSNLVDIKVFLFNNIAAVLGFLSVLAFTPAVTAGVLHGLNQLAGSSSVAGEITTLQAAIATVLMILTFDFCKYWAHYIHHENSFLWPFHALHHSAEVLTPLTASRNHPVFLLIRSAIFSVVVGAVQALMLFAFVPQIDIITIGSANAGYVIFNLLGSNLRHSHIWLSYGPVLEHIFISPAQHQIHHSRAVEHHNKNYGEVFAFWDWMFGTLYVPQKHEILEFGLADSQGQPIAQPHPTLRAALLQPFIESWRVAQKHRKKVLPSQDVRQP